MPEWEILSIPFICLDLDNFTYLYSIMVLITFNKKVKKYKKKHTELKKYSIISFLYIYNSVYQMNVRVRISPRDFEEWPRFL